MKLILEILSKVPFWKASRFLVLIPLVYLISCSFLRDSVSFVGDYSLNNLPVTITEYNYLTKEKPKVKLKGFENFDFNVSTESFYIKRTIKLSDLLLDNGKKFKESEERREKERYLTLR
jgi:hypothetical protein